MSFWSGEKLASLLPSLIDPFRPQNIDCAAYKLRVGPETYITPQFEPTNPTAHGKIQLTEGQGFAIPSGQFAFLLTEERIEVPTNAIALISIRARHKFKGLVNVSGFHVDPGYKGRLVFAVFNAGPAPVHLARGDDCFLIWFADLDSSSTMVKNAPGFDAISSDLINPIPGAVQSFATIRENIEDVEKRITERLHKIEKDHEKMWWAAGLAIAGLVAVLTALTVRYFAPVAPVAGLPTGTVAAPSPTPSQGSQTAPPTISPPATSPPVRRGR